MPFGKFLAVSMVHLGNSSSEGCWQRIVIGKKEEGRLGKAKIPSLKWRC